MAHVDRKLRASGAGTFEEPPPLEVIELEEGGKIDVPILCAVKLGWVILDGLGCSESCWDMAVPDTTKLRDGGRLNALEGGV